MVRSVSAAFLADLEVHWQKVGTKVLDIVAEKYPDLYFQGMIQLTKINRIEIGKAGDFDRAKTKEEVLQRLEESCRSARPQDLRAVPAPRRAPRS